MDDDLGDSSRDSAGGGDLRRHVDRRVASPTAQRRRVDRLAPNLAALSVVGYVAHFGSVEAMTAVVMRGADLIGRPVVNGETGDALGEIRDVVFDAKRGAITGFTLRKRGFLGSRMDQVLPIDSVVSVGTDAVMVNGREALVEADAAPDTMSTDRDVNVIDDRVITESGRVLGTVRDVIVVGGSSPRIVGFEVGGGSAGDGIVSLGAHTAVSGNALIVPDSYEHRMRSDLTGHAAELSLIDSVTP